MYVMQFFFIKWDINYSAQMTFSRNPASLFFVMNQSNLHTIDRFENKIGIHWLTGAPDIQPWWTHAHGIYWSESVYISRPERFTRFWIAREGILSELTYFGSCLFFLWCIYKQHSKTTNFQVLQKSGVSRLLSVAHAANATALLIRHMSTL